MQVTAGEAKMKTSVMLSNGIRHMDVRVLVNQEEHAYNSSVWTRDVV